MSDRPLHILHLTAGSDAGGLSRYVFDLSSAMRVAGHYVTVAGQRGAWHWLFEDAPFPWIDLPLKGGPVALWAAARQLREWMRNHPVDVIHTHYRRPTLVARRLGRPVLYTLHLSHLSLVFPRGLLSDFGDHTHVASEEALEWLTRDAAVPAERVTLIPHGIDPARFPVADRAARAAAKRALGLGEDDLVAAYVGRLDDPKNVDWILDVALRAPQATFVIAGEGPHEPTLRNRIGKDALDSRVQLLGHREPLPIYQAADALLLPSAREGFSYVCAEAMAVGTPVLRTRTSGTRGLILEGETGRSCPIDHESFVRAAADFLADRAALARMGTAAAEHVRAHFTFDRQLEQTLALYRHLAQHSG